MQPYTHLAIGAAVAEVFFPGQYPAEAACVIASVAPDFTMVPQYGFDLLAGRTPMIQQSSRLMLVKEIGHSLPLWALLGILSMFLTPPLQPIVLAAGIGGLIHCIVDVFTHGTGPKEKRPFWDTDVKFMWPTRIDLRPLGLWEYRTGYGVRMPKPFEALVLICCLAFVAWRILQ